MSFVDDYLVSTVVLLPMLGAVLALAFPKGEYSGVRGFTLAVTLVDLALAVWLWVRFDPAAGMQMQERVDWVPSLGIEYAVGVDGLSVLLVLLTAFLAPIVVLSTYSSVKDRVREFMVCTLFLQTGMLGAFVATDLFLFYVYWEVMLVPMYFMIGIWGGRRRIYAAVKFFIYTMAGSLLMLVAILYTVWAVRDRGGLTFSYLEVAERLAAMPNGLGGAEVWVFLAFALAFAIKVPMFPFHTWLPDAHVEAPTGGSVILAGVLLKLGTFGFLRYALWLFPKTAVAFLPAIGLIAVIGIIYGALVAMVQEDFKRLVAFSSVSHLGFVMLGITAMTVNGVSGGLLQMVNHGISTGALFLLVGVIYERRHTRQLDDFGGLAKVMPRYAAVFVIIALSSIGLPGLNGFVGEFMILLGTFQSEGIHLQAQTSSLAWAGIVAVELVALGAVFLIALAVMRGNQREKLGQPTKATVIIGSLAAALVLVAPPIGGYSGGLLVKPLAVPLCGNQGCVAAIDQTGDFQEVFAVFAVLAGTGVIFAAVYLLLATQRVFFGPIRHAENQKLEDLSAREMLVMAPLVIVAVFMGIYPKPFLDAINPTVAAYARDFRARASIAQLRDADLASAAGVRPAGVRPPATPARSANEPGMIRGRFDDAGKVVEPQPNGLAAPAGKIIRDPRDPRARMRREAQLPKLPWKRSVDARRERIRQETKER